MKPESVREPLVGAGALAALVLAAGAAALGWLTFRDIRSADLDAEALMSAQARSIASLVGASGMHGLDAYRRWEDEVAERLLDNARWLAREDSLRPLGSRDLHTYARLHSLGRINLFDARGEKVATSVVEPEETVPPRHDPRDYIGPVLRGEVRELRIGFKPARFRGGSRFAVAVARRRGGAVVVNVFADSMRAVLDDVRPAHLLATLGRADGVRYLVLQAGDSVLARAPTDGSGIPAPEIRGAAGSPGEVRVRELRASGGRVYEATRRLAEGVPGPLTLRVGLDAGPLDRARKAVLQRTLMRALVFGLVAGLGATLLLLRERQSRLAGDYARVRAELAERERDAQRSARLVAMGELAGHVAHEIRNPLNTIHLTAQELERDPTLGDGLRARLEDVRAESQRIEAIVRQFLDFARPRRPQPEWLDLAEAVRGAARAAEPLGSSRRVRVESAGGPVRAWLDPLLLGEILDNLLRNACEASPTGGRVRIEATSRGRDVIVSVEDDGPGVPVELRERIFDPYYTTKASGTGLGLSIVAQLAAAMGGGVGVVDAPGAGARFELRFPAARSEA